MASLKLLGLSLRVAQVVCAIIAASCLGAGLNQAATSNNAYAGWNGYGWLSGSLFSALTFAVFTAGGACVISAVSLALYFHPSWGQHYRGLFDLVIASVWTLFWFASVCAVGAAQAGLVLSASCGCSVLKAGWAFALFSLVLWLANVVLAVFDMRAGCGVAGQRVGSSPNAPTTQTAAANNIPMTGPANNFPVAAQDKLPASVLAAQDKLPA